MATQVVNSELIDLLRPFFVEKPTAIGTTVTGMLNLPPCDNTIAGGILYITGGVGGAGSVTLQPGPVTGDDTYLYEASAATHYNAAASINVSTAVGTDTNTLIRFDLTGIPAGSLVTAATLTLWNITTGMVDRTFNVHRILPANIGWLQASANWNFADDVGATRWAGDAGADGGPDAGCSVAGTDYAAAVMGTFTYTAGMAAYTAFPIVLDTGQMDLMVASNAGFLVRGGIFSAFAFVSADSGAHPAERPELVVDYASPTGCKSSYQRVETQGAAATDDLDSIDGGTEGDLIILTAQNDAHTVVVKDTTGNLRLAGADMSLDSADDTITLLYDGTNWLEMARSNNG